jgi:hypothetical protein
LGPLLSFGNARMGGNSYLRRECREHQFVIAAPGCKASMAVTLWVRWGRYARWKPAGLLVFAGRPTRTSLPLFVNAQALMGQRPGEFQG